MAIQYKQKCDRCKTNFVLTTRRSRVNICYDCHKPEMEGEIKDKKMKKMFDIPEEFYKESNFLRDIKIKYLRFGELTENQLNAFEKVVSEFKERK